MHRLPVLPFSGVGGPEHHQEALAAGAHPGSHAHAGACSEVQRLAGARLAGARPRGNRVRPARARARRCATTSWWRWRT